MCGLLCLSGSARINQSRIHSYQQRILPLISVFAAYAEEPFTRYDRVISRLMLQCSPQSMTASSRIRQTELYDGEHKRTRRELVDFVLLWSYLNHMDDHAKL